MGRSTVHYADSETNNILKRLHNKLRPAGTPVERVEYIIELLLLRIFEAKLKQDSDFNPLRALFTGENYRLLFSHLLSMTGDQVLATLNQQVFPFYSTILSKSREVIKGNLPVKIQDQLVLMEEVFANSNFTNNVKGGVISEVVGLVNDIDEKRILMTDLLGDAIESALSETGGNQELGLYRTPDHIRRMMVEMVDPEFSDTIFDPACGTAGFLFDAYEYVVAKAKKTRKFPSERVANQFYRTGIGGTEYQGRIRKMAAVNMYIRGLNPHNIQQGDSLRMYDPAKDAGTKSVVIANPPFGAERDQPAYPNVWEDYARETETTILFVKLMIDLLREGGRCAVVVSEGLLTWGQSSACALRKFLLQETNLRAIISLPHGVFVSKNGQGAKTSILYFEKGQPTNFVWHYRVTNDGFSMGTNRKPISGSQIPEVLREFAKVKSGEYLPPNERSFCIPRLWIETLDPRDKERIQQEVNDRLTETISKRREALVSQLDARLQKSQITKFEHNERLDGFDSLAASQLESEVTKAIEKSYTYHLNLPRYRSSLSNEQRLRWSEIFRDLAQDKRTTLDRQYKRLKSTKPVDALSILASFDADNALEVDLVREYIAHLASVGHLTDTRLVTLQRILRTDSRYPRVSLAKLISPKSEKLSKEAYRGDLPIVEKIEFSKGKIFFRAAKETGMNLCVARAGNLVTSKINLHQGAVALAPCDLVCTTHYQVYEIDTTRADPSFLITMMRSEEFLREINAEKAGGIKNESGPDFISKFTLPLPTELTEQRAIVKALSRYQEVIAAAESILENARFDAELPLDNLRPIGDAVIETRNGWSPVCNGGTLKVLSLSCLKNGMIDYTQIKFTENTRPDIDKFEVRVGDFFYSRGNTKELVALAGVAGTVPDTIIFPDLLTRVEFDESLILPAYAVILFNSAFGRKYFGAVPEGGTPNMVKVSQDYMKNFRVPLLGEIESQRKIISMADEHQSRLKSVASLKSDAQLHLKSEVDYLWNGIQ